MSSWLFVSACGALCYTGFCRLVSTDRATILYIRLVIWALTVSAACSIAAVLVWRYVPGWPSATLAACMASMQAATLLMWREGVPKPYRLPKAHWWQR